MRRWSRAAWLVAGPTLCAAGGAAAQDTAAAVTPAPAAAAPAAATVPFRVGERLEYDVKFGMFRVGRATMEVLGIDTIRGEPVYHVVFAIRGRAVVYSMNDTLESWFAVSDLTSRRFVRDTEENGRARRAHFEIYPERGVFVRDDRDTSEVTPDPLDDASFFYFARTLDLEVGRTYSYARYFRPDRNPVTLRVLGRDTVEVPAGRFAVVGVRPVFRSRGLFAEGGQAVIYMADDETRIPVQIRSRTSLGSITMHLRRWTRP